MSEEPDLMWWTMACMHGFIGSGDEHGFAGRAPPGPPVVPSAGGRNFSRCSCSSILLSCPGRCVHFRDLLIPFASLPINSRRLH